MEFKVCSGKYGCGKTKPLSEFCLKKAKNGKYYPNSYCNKCNSKSASKYQKDHATKKSEYNKQYVEKNKEKHQAQSKAWYKKNKEKIKKRSTERYNKFKKEIFERGKERYRNDVQYKIALNLRRRLYGALKGRWKTGSFVKDLGCTIKELINILESMFYTDPITKESMNWENYGKWHLDHIIPLDAFDLTDYGQFKTACHYTNLQPLWAEHNLSKSNRVMSEEELEQLKTT